MNSASADPGILYVNGSSGNDSWDGQSAVYDDVTGSGPKLSIQNATGTVTDNGVVNIANGQYTGENNTNITIARSMTIIGESQSNTIINGTGTNWIFRINSGLSVTIQNLTLTNGTAESGGAIYNEGNLTITNSNFNTNTASNGGAIYNEGNLTITNSNFNTNTASTGGGAILNWCSFGLFDSGTITSTVTDCFFTENSAESGGAILNYCLMYFYGLGSLTSTVNYCSFTDNNATVEGGAIANYCVSVYSYSCSLNSTVNACNFTDNSADSGGAIEEYSTVIYDGSCSLTSSVTESNFTRNTATNNGGAINYYNEDVASLTGTMTGCNFINNTATNNGGAIANDGGTCEIHFNRINNNPNIDVFSNTTGVNATKNWWGSNFIGTNPETASKININVIADPWVILSVNATPDTINNGETSTINSDFNHINGGGDLVGGQIPDGPITLDIPWGSFESPTIAHSITITTVNGAITPTTFYANEGSVVFSPVPVNASSDGYTTTTESALIYINKFSNLNINKTGAVSVIAGNSVNYTITITNNGPDPAEGVSLIDTITNIGVFNTGTLQYRWKSNDGDWSDWTDFINPLILNIGTIDVNKTALIQINGTVNSSTLKGTSIINNATTNTTTTPGNKSSHITTTVDTLADVDLTKIVDNSRPNVGENVTFTVTAHNYGPSDATNIQIEDIMPPEFADITVTPSKGTYNNITGIWTLDLLSGEEANLTLTGTATVMMAGKNTTNNATKLSQTEADPDSLDTANATTYVPKADLYIQITSDKNNPFIGETFTLTYKLGNKGPDDALNVTITVSLPEGFVISQITGDGTWVINGNIIIWTFNNVTVGDPYLHIAGWTTGPGIYVFGASIASDTFSINSLGVNSLTINALPQVNAAPNTIGMQNTGTPINYLILAILLIVSSMIMPKRNK